MPCRTELRSESGVTLTELMVSLVITSVILVAILSFYGTSIRQNLVDKARSEIKFLAEQEMEKLLSLPYDSNTLGAFSSERSDVYELNTNFIVKRKIAILDPEKGTVKDPYPNSKEEDPHLKQITISVTRKDGLGGQIDMINFKTP
jgi:prepilin-type N-terminal cleavage/methylation domain-containing protein